MLGSAGTVVQVCTRLRVGWYMVLCGFVQVWGLLYVVGYIMSCSQRVAGKGPHDERRVGCGSGCCSLPAVVGDVCPAGVDQSRTHSVLWLCACASSRTGGTALLRPAVVLSSELGLSGRDVGTASTVLSLCCSVVCCTCLYTTPFLEALVAHSSISSRAVVCAAVACFLCMNACAPTSNCRPLFRR